MSARDTDNSKRVTSSSGGRRQSGHIDADRRFIFDAMSDITLALQMISKLCVEVAQENKELRKRVEQLEEDVSYLHAYKAESNKKGGRYVE